MINDELTYVTHLIIVEPAQWQQLVNSEETVREHQLSREEELLRERMRATGFGITSYSFNAR